MEHVDGMTSTSQFAGQKDLTAREKILLLRGSDLNGSRFIPWDGPPRPEEFAQPFTDPTEFRFSTSQLEIFDGWKRPQDALSDPKILSGQKLDLVQDGTSDCSFVASLCALVARRGKESVDSMMGIRMYPVDDRKPVLSPNGKYVFQFHFNGCARRVVIDDRLPTSRTERSLHVVDRLCSNLFWPALVEKAYLKVMGGYDFPGSNSGTDLWLLMGSIPEQIFLQRYPRCHSLDWSVASC